MVTGRPEEDRGGLATTRGGGDNWCTGRELERAQELELVVGAVAVVTDEGVRGLGGGLYIGEEGESSVARGVMATTIDGGRELRKRPLPGSEEEEEGEVNAGARLRQ